MPDISISTEQSDRGSPSSPKDFSNMQQSDIETKILQVEIVDAANSKHKEQKVQTRKPGREGTRDDSRKVSKKNLSGLKTPTKNSSLVILSPARATSPTDAFQKSLRQDVDITSPVTRTLSPKQPYTPNNHSLVRNIIESAYGDIFFSRREKQRPKKLETTTPSSSSKKPSLVHQVKHIHKALGLKKSNSRISTDLEQQRKDLEERSRKLEDEELQLKINIMQHRRTSTHELKTLQEKQEQFETWKQEETLKFQQSKQLIETECRLLQEAKRSIEIELQVLEERRNGLKEEIDSLQVEVATGVIELKSSIADFDGEIRKEFQRLKNEDLRLKILAEELKHNFEYNTTENLKLAQLSEEINSSLQKIMKVKEEFREERSKISQPISNTEVYTEEEEELRREEEEEKQRLAAEVAKTLSIPASSATKKRASVLGRLFGGSTDAVDNSRGVQDSVPLVVSLFIQVSLSIFLIMVLCRSKTTTTIAPTT